MVRHFSKLHASKGLPPIEPTPALIEALMGYQWPGNIRELSNLMARFSALFAGRKVCLGDIPREMLPKGLRNAPGVQDISVPRSAPAAAAKAATAATAAPTRPAAASAVDEQDALLGITTPAEPIVAGTSRPLVAPGDYNPVEDLISLAQGAPLVVLDGVPLKKRLTDIERALIEQALEQADGNVSKTARLLSVQRTTLIEKNQQIRPEVQARSRCGRGRRAVERSALRRAAWPCPISRRQSPQCADSVRDLAACRCCPPGVYRHGHSR